MCCFVMAIAHLEGRWEMMEWGWMVIAGGNRRALRETCSSATAFTTNLINPSLRSGKKSSGSMSYGTAAVVTFAIVFWVRSINLQMSDDALG